MPTEEAMQSASDIEDIALPDIGNTPGGRLLAERERCGITEKAVADRLHITMHYVRAIESNRFEKLPGSVFAKGYIKSYAEFLGLDVEEIAALYDEINSDQKAAKEEVSRRQQSQRRSDRNKPWVYISVGCFIAGFILLWVLTTYFSSDSNAAPAPVSNTTTPVSAPARVELRTTIAQTAPIFSPVQSSALAPALVEAEVAPVTAETLPGALTTTTDAIVSAPASAELSNPDYDLSSDVAAVIASTPLPELASAETELTTLDFATAETGPRLIEIDGAGDDILRISFSGDSWVEIRDSGEGEVYRDLREAGDILEITGDAPFNILLGDAPFTTMSLNGTEIDVSDNIRIDNSARLTVGL